MCMRCWDDAPACPRCNPPPAYIPPPPEPKYRPKRPRKAKSHFCRVCRTKLPANRVRWDDFTESWECKDITKCNQRLWDTLPEDLKEFYKTVLTKQAHKGQKRERVRKNVRT